MNTIGPSPKQPESGQHAALDRTPDGLRVPLLPGDIGDAAQRVLYEAYGGHPPSSGVPGVEVPQDETGDVWAGVLTGADAKAIAREDRGVTEEQTRALAAEKLDRKLTATYGAEELAVMQQMVIDSGFATDVPSANGYLDRYLTDSQEPRS